MTKTKKATKRLPCEACSGSGADLRKWRAECKHCEGSGLEPAMIPPDYTALERKARFYASRRRASGGYTLAEFLEESADALALAASLQEENKRILRKIRALKEAHDRDAVENEFFDVLAEAQ